MSSINELFDRFMQRLYELQEKKALYDAGASAEAFHEATLRRQTAEQTLKRVKNYNRPCLFLDVDIHPIEQNGRTVYCASYSGLVVYGETPDIAFDNFDRLWIEGDRS